MPKEEMKCDCGGALSVRKVSVMKPQEPPRMEESTSENETDDSEDLDRFMFDEPEQPDVVRSSYFIRLLCCDTCRIPSPIDFEPEE